MYVEPNSRHARVHTPHSPTGPHAPLALATLASDERYLNLLSGNGLQPGYQAELIFEVELVKIREKKGNKPAEEGGGEEGAAASAVPAA